MESPSWEFVELRRQTPKNQIYLDGKDGWGCFLKDVKITVFVTPKKNVLDPQGAAVAHAMESLGFENLKGVRMGKVIELEMEEQPDEGFEASVDRVCRDLLSNPVIEDYRWSVERARE